MQIEKISKLENSSLKNQADVHPTQLSIFLKDNNNKNG